MLVVKEEVNTIKLGDLISHKKKCGGNVSNVNVNPARTFVRYYKSNVLSQYDYAHRSPRNAPFTEGYRW